MVELPVVPLPPVIAIAAVDVPPPHIECREVVKPLVAVQVEPLKDSDEVVS